LERDAQRLMRLVVEQGVAATVAAAAATAAAAAAVQGLVHIEPTQ
jgi:hypothetical protein